MLLAIGGMHGTYADTQKMPFIVFPGDHFEFDLHGDFLLVTKRSGVDVETRAFHGSPLSLVDVVKSLFVMKTLCEEYYYPVSSQQVESVSAYTVV